MCIRDRAKTSQRDQELTQRERGIFVKGLSQTVLPVLKSSADKAAKVVLRGRALKPEAMASFSSDIYAEYNRLAKQDTTFQANAKKYLDAGDEDGFARASRASIAKLMPTAAKNIYRKFSGFSSQESAERKAEGQARTETAAGGTVTDSLARYTGQMIQGGPDPKMIDWQRMIAETGSRKAAEDMLFEHKFYVKNQKSQFYF